MRVHFCIESTTAIFIKLFYRKAIMQDMVKCSNFTTEKFLELYTRMQKAIETIKPIDEYRDFIGKNKYINLQEYRFIVQLNF